MTVRRGRLSRAQVAALPRLREHPEKDLQDAVIALLKMHRWAVYHTWDSRHSEAGFPDIIAVRGDRMLALECKSSKGVVTQAQRNWLEALEQVRWSTAAVVRPAPDLQEVEVLVR